MTDVVAAERVANEELRELEAWLEANWDPELTVAAWWERLGMAGWAQPLLPRGAFGRALSYGDAQAVHRAVERFGALGAPMGLGLLLAAPTIATHGTTEQVARLVPDIVTGRRAWCQLFSEPNAGSDLAGLQTRAVRDGDAWIVNGQKVWTSGGNLADRGMLLARTNPDVPKHRGITWFAIDMHQPGIEVRPLKEMTGSTMFCEVFFTDAVVVDADRIGDVDDGWRVANTTLLFERTGMGAGARPVPTARPGTVAGDLDRRAGDLVGAPRRGDADDAGERRASPAGDLIALAARSGRGGDPLVREALVRLHVLGELARLSTLRLRAARAAGRDVPGTPSFTKLAMADALRLRRDLGLRLLGATGTLHGYTDEERRALADALGDASFLTVTAQALAAQALPIFGGTDQIQRNILAERVLGLPKEPGDLSQLPFSQLPKNR